MTKAIPDFVSHYYLPDRPPFLSLSDLEGHVEDPAFVEMLNKHKTDSSYKRRYSKKYLKVRMDAENKLRRLFRQRGGKPRRPYPLYFVLGSSDWFRFLNSEHRELRIGLKDLPPETVSVTFQIVS